MCFWHHIGEFGPQKDPGRAEKAKSERPLQAPPGRASAAGRDIPSGTQMPPTQRPQSRWNVPPGLDGAPFAGHVTFGAVRAVRTPGLAAPWLHPRACELDRIGCDVCWLCQTDSMLFKYLDQAGCQMCMIHLLCEIIIRLNFCARLIRTF